MSGILPRALIVGLWLVSTGWFVRFEAFPGRFTGSSRGYRDILSVDTIVRDSWMRLLYNNVPVGYSHAKVEMNDESATSRYQMENETQMTFSLAGTRQVLSVNADASLDALYRLQSFEIHASFGKTDVRVTARRSHDTVFALKLQSGDSTRVTTMSIPDEAVIYSPMTGIAVSRLRPGQQMTVKSLDPVSMSTANVVVRALDRETVLSGGERVPATVVATEYMGITTRSWLDNEGNLLRQETPFGLVAEAVEPHEAMAAARGSAEVDGVLGRELVNMLGIPGGGSKGDAQ